VQVHPLIAAEFANLLICIDIRSSANGAALAPDLACGLRSYQCKEAKAAAAAITAVRAPRRAFALTEAPALAKDVAPRMLPWAPTVVRSKPECQQGNR
jgi:hypothetical protein